MVLEALLQAYREYELQHRELVATESRERYWDERHRLRTTNQARLKQISEHFGIPFSAEFYLPSESSGRPIIDISSPLFNRLDFARTYSQMFNISKGFQYNASVRYDFADFLQDTAFDIRHFSNFVAKKKIADVENRPLSEESSCTVEKGDPFYLQRQDCYGEHFVVSTYHKSKWGLLLDSVPQSEQKCRLSLRFQDTDFNELFPVKGFSDRVKRAWHLRQFTTRSSPLDGVVKAMTGSSSDFYRADISVEEYKRLADKYGDNVQKAISSMKFLLSEDKREDLALVRRMVRIIYQTWPKNYPAPGTPLIDRDQAEMLLQREMESIDLSSVDPTMVKRAQQFIGLKNLLFYHHALHYTSPRKTISIGFSMGEFPDYDGAEDVYHTHPQIERCLEAFVEGREFDASWKPDNYGVDTNEVKMSGTNFRALLKRTVERYANQRKDDLIERYIKMQTPGYQFHIYGEMKHPLEHSGFAQAPHPMNLPNKIKCNQFEIKLGEEFIMVDAIDRKCGHIRMSARESKIKPVVQWALEEARRFPVF